MVSCIGVPQAAFVYILKKCLMTSCENTLRDCLYIHKLLSCSLPARTSSPEAERHVLQKIKCELERNNDPLKDK